MNAAVLQGSRGVILEFAALPPVLESPRLGGLILSLVRASGSYEAGAIDLRADGIPRPFGGDIWRAAWRRNGESGWNLRLGFPDDLFAASFDPVIRMAVEAVEAGTSATLGALAVTVAPPAHRAGGEWPAWLPPEYALEPVRK